MPESRPSTTVVVLVVGCVALFAVDVALVVRNRALATRVDQLGAMIERAALPPLAQGHELPAISLFDARGRAVRVVGDEAPPATLLLLSSDACDRCKVVEAWWLEASALADGSTVRALRVVLDATPDTLDDDPTTPYTTVAPGGDAWALTQQIPGVPGAVLVHADGRVRRTFFGENHAGLPDAVESLVSELRQQTARH